MHKKTAFLIALLVSLTSHSNDAIFSGEGATLAPTTKTNIELRKENLNLTFSGNLIVDVYFEFYNPGDTQNLTVGFVTPPMDTPEDEDVPMEYLLPIENFTVVANGESLPYETAVLEDSDFDFLKSERKGETFVYYFTVKFPPGRNIIQHNYEFGGVYFSTGESYYDYILSTGTYWGNKQIDDFNLKIDMGPEAYFHVTNFPNMSSQETWKIIGKGQNRGGTFFIKEGYIEFTARNFKPTTELSIHFPPGLFNGPFIRDSEFSKMYNAVEETLQKLPKSELRILRNNFFAASGYSFKDKELFDYYSQFAWYMPGICLIKT